MDLHMPSHKRPLFIKGYENEPPVCTKKCLMSLGILLGGYQAEKTDRARLKTSCGHSCRAEACVNSNNDPAFFETFLKLLSSWADTQFSVKKVLEHLKFRQADDNDDIFLGDTVSKRFIEFHRDITEECGAEDKQHSWAVIEKPEEVVMYGPYYPDYNNGEHSEDIIIKQTQELLQSEAPSEDWKVYVFTLNSPCLARNTGPCMLNLFQKAHEWWIVYGVKTHIGYVKCWGFKGTKENLFRDINYSQVHCIDKTEDHESYLKATETSSDLHPVCESLFSAVKFLLRSVTILSINTVQSQDSKSHFKSMHSILPDDKRDVCSQEVNNMVEAAHALLSEKRGSFEECLENGRLFALGYSFSSQLSDQIQDQLRLAFQQSWKEMVQDKYAEFIREKLTEVFNQSAVRLYIRDTAKFTREYLQIGRIRFKKENSVNFQC